MAYGSNLHRGGGRMSASGNAGNFSGYQTIRNSYVDPGLAVRRHEYTGGGPDIGSANTLLPNNWFGTILARFKRAFGGTDDSGPTATASNNYQSPSVFNGGLIGDYKATIRLKNNEQDTRYLDVYENAFSFFDALIESTQFSGQGVAIHSFQTASATPNLQGEVNFLTPNGTQMFSNTIKNFVNLQRYQRFLGTVTLGGVDSGSNTVEIKVNDIPAKCKRSQTGMFFGYVFHNDIAKNGSNALTLSYDSEISFTEIPGLVRMPYLY